MSKEAADNDHEEEVEHMKRLGKLLRANGLKMKNTAKDGDCLFTSTIEMAQLSITALELREIVCNHMLEFNSEYEGFLLSDKPYDVHVHELQKPGSWNSEVGNLVPYALSNLFQCDIQIFSSDPRMQIVNIIPTILNPLHPQSSKSTLLQYAYISIPNHEHYNPVKTGDNFVVPLLHYATLGIPEWQDVLSVEEFMNTMTEGGETEDVTIAVEYIANLSHDGKLGALEKEDYQEGFSSDGGQHEDREVEVKETEDNEDGKETVNSEDLPAEREVEGMEMSHADGKATANSKDMPDKHLEGKEILDDKAEAAKDKENMSGKKSRRKIAAPEEWKANKKKKQRLHGETYKYVSKKGKEVTVLAKKVQNIDKKKCRFNCAETFGEIQRAKMFSEYWALDSKTRKQDFLCALIEERLPETHKVNPTKQKRNVVRHYFLQYEQERAQVCEEHFLATFDICKSVVRTALKYRGTSGLTVAQRPKHSPATKVPEDDLDVIRGHINSFPKMQSHYCRKDTKREYLDKSLNVQKMYELYIESCKAKNIEPQKQHIYRRVFNTEFNLAFHHPKKDLCAKCEKYKQGGPVSQDEFEDHQQKKEQARKEKEKDKQEAKEHKNIHALTFDLEQVLSLPKSSISNFYYKRKLSLYNLTTYSLGNRDVKCFLWAEMDGKRGACEVGSCLVQYISSLPDTIDHVILYSDCCSGQNRNQYIFAALLFALEQNPHIKSIEQKFLVSGHTEMEVDSVHSAIEKAASVVELYSYDDWYTTIRLARKRHPYQVVLMDKDAFIDLKAMSKKALLNAKINTKGEKVNWLQICHIMFTKGSLTAKYRYSFTSPFQEIAVRRTSTQTRNSASQDTSLRPVALYEDKIPISAAKEKDLRELCESGCIPERYHYIYTNLDNSPMDDVVPYIESDKEDGL